ncbi:cell division protein ZipA [Salinimonas lutimaris]|uniref:cell division protein ZipA n=1 Tax=Salinimonas lutimaris TaxID=914153 RepID=UPI0010C07956|nr:cell division protein ZipA [Salinimonas lutimaris]
MEDQLRLSLLIIGSIIIVAVFAHGIWKIRKNGQPAKRNRVEPQQWDESSSFTGSDTDDDNEQRFSSGFAQSDTDSFDELGVGKVRVVESGQSSPIPSSDDHDSAGKDETAAAQTQARVQSESSASKQEEKLYGSVVTNPKPHMQTPAEPAHAEGEKEDIPPPPGFLLKENSASGEDSATSGVAPAQAPASHRAADEEVESFSLDSPEVDEDAAAVSRKPRHYTRQRQEPSLGDDQMRIDFDKPAGTPSAKPESATAAKPAANRQTADAEQEVLVINVKAPDGEPISGASLLPMLLTLGFKFGEQDIFHRHANASGKGPVLFSLANMFKPGNFDIDNLEMFTTQGVSLFMILPIEADAHQVFNMMHNAARKIAEEFDGQVLDGRRSVLSKQGLQQYIEKIREFERRQQLLRT